MRVVSKRKRRPCWGRLLVLSACLGLAGCSYQWPLLRRQQFGPPLPDDASVSHVVDRLNSNILQVHSWRSTDVHITGRMMPLGLTAYLAVERPRMLRLRANSPLGEEADLGSNSDWYWIWMKRGPRKLFYGRHEEIAEVAQSMQIPFQPDLLMQSLGVIPIDAGECTLHNHPHDKRMMQLITAARTPSGSTVRRVIDVDTRVGLIKAYSLLDEHGALVARATLSNHRLEKTAGVVLPHRIQLEWPQTRMDLRIDINHIDVNPTHVAEQTWKMPRKPGYEPINLASRQRPYMPVGAQPLERGDRAIRVRPRVREEIASENQNPFEQPSFWAERPDDR